MLSFHGQSGNTVQTGLRRLSINTISQLLISFNDVASTTSVYALYMKTNSEMKKGDQKGNQKMIILTHISISPSSVKGQPKVYDRGQVSCSVSWRVASRHRILCFDPGRDALPGSRN
jgi:hypothetical protein